MNHSDSARDLRWAALVFLGAFLIFWILRQESYWGDAKSFIRRLEEGSLRHHHFAYPSIAAGLHRLTGLFGNDDAKLTLQLLSVLSGSMAAGLFFLTARKLHFPHMVALLGVVLFCCTPVVFFYSTCIEAHAPQLALASGASLWAVSQRETGTKSALAAALLLIGIYGTHMTGVLWAPALLVICCWDGARLRRPRHVALGIVALALSVLAWKLANPAPDGRGTAPVGLALSVLTKIHPKNLWANFVQPMGLCSLLGFIALITYRQRLRMEWKRPIVLASLLLFAAMLPFMVTLHIYERGGYYITLAIPVVLLSCAVLSSSAPVLRRFAPLALLLQVFLTGKAYYEWEIAYPGADWVPILEAELEGQGIIIAQDFPEWRAIHHHTRVTSISAKMPRHADDDMASRGEEVVLHMMRVSRSRNWKVGVTRRFWENDAPLNVQLKRLMREQFGEPQPGRRGEYLLFDSEADSPHD